jgi:hypothetical protein
VDRTASLAHPPSTLVKERAVRLFPEDLLRSLSEQGHGLQALPDGPRLLAPPPVYRIDLLLGPQGRAAVPPRGGRLASKGWPITLGSAAIFPQFAVR